MRHRPIMAPAQPGFNPVCRSPLAISNCLANWIHLAKASTPHEPRCFPRRTPMSDPRQTGRTEPRWPPALAILAVLGLVAVLPHHVQLPPWWVPYLVVFAVLLPMAAVTFTKADAFWLLVERRMIMLFAALYIVNTTAELADMIGIITLHPPETRQISLLSSSLAIWVTNVLS